MEVNVESGGSEQGGTEQAGGGAAAEFDISPVLEQVTKLGETLDSRLGEFEQRLPQAEPQPDPYNRNEFGQFAGLPQEQQPWAGQQPGMQPGAQQGMYDEYGELTPEAAQAQLQAMINPIVGPMQQQMQQMSQQYAALQQTMQELEMDRGAEHLEQTYPELQDPEKATALVEHASRLAQQLNLPGDLVGRSGFLELVHKAQRADAAAAGETAATPGPTLEPAGGASLAGSEPTPQERIKNAGPKHPAWF